MKVVLAAGLTASASAAGKEPVMSNTLCIENLSSHEGTAEVERLLKPFGPVRCAAMVTDPDMLRQSPGIALMEMPSARQARAAMAALDGMQYRGGTLRVRPAVAADVARARWVCRWALPVQEPPSACGEPLPRPRPRAGNVAGAAAMPRPRKGACHDIADHSAVDIVPRSNEPVLLVHVGGMLVRSARTPPCLLLCSSVARAH